MSRRNSSESENSNPRHRDLPHYDTVDDIGEHQNVNEVEVKSNRGSTVASNAPHVTITQNETNDAGERQVTVIEIASRKGSSRTPNPKVDSSIPLPEHPAKKSNAPKSPRPENESIREMEFDIGPGNIAPVLSYKMNMEDRDPTNSVKHLNATFFEIFAEPQEQYRSIACVWTLSFKVFEIVRIYTYKILTLIFGLLIAFIGGFGFALFAFLNIWILRPSLVLSRMALSQILLLWPMLLIYIVRPFFYSVGAIFSTARLHTSRGEQVVEVWERHVHHV